MSKGRMARSAAVVNVLRGKEIRMETVSAWLCVALLACVVVGAAGCSVYAGTVTKPESTRVIEVATPLGDAKTFEAATDNGAITVAGKDAEDCTVVATVRAWASKKERADALAAGTSVELVPSGDVLSVKITRPPASRGESVVVSLAVTLPKRAALALATENGRIVADDVSATSAKTENGRIQCSNIKGPVRVETQNGAVTCTNVTGDLSVKTENGAVQCATVGGSADLATRNGAVDCTGVAGDLRVKSKNGAVTCLDVRGNATIGTENGRVTVAYAKDAPPKPSIAIETENGAVEFSAPESFSAEIVISTHRGHVSVALAMSVKVKREGRLEGTIGEGGGSLRVTTENGRISVK